MHVKKRSENRCCTSLYWARVYSRCLRGNLVMRCRRPMTSSWTRCVSMHSRLSSSASGNSRLRQTSYRISSKAGCARRFSIVKGWRWGWIAKTRCCVSELLDRWSTSPKSSLNQHPDLVNSKRGSPKTPTTTASIRISASDSCTSIQPRMARRSRPGSRRPVRHWQGVKCLPATYRYCLQRWRTHRLPTFAAALARRLLNRYRRLPSANGWARSHPAMACTLSRLIRCRRRGCLNSARSVTRSSEITFRANAHAQESCLRDAARAL